MGPVRHLGLEEGFSGIVMGDKGDRETSTHQERGYFAVSGHSTKYIQ